MKIIKTFYPSDFDSSLPILDYKSFTPRTAGRAVIINDNKVALIYIRKHDYYMLPGGGISEEDIESGLKREIREEIGCDIKIMALIGAIEVYFDLWKQKQTDYCYIVNAINSDNKRDITNFEKEEGHEVIWANSITEAVGLIKNAIPNNLDGKLVRARDLSFLQKAQRMLRQP